MAITKRKVSLTLDEELVKALEGDDGLSAQVNNALVGLNGAAKRRVRQAMVDALLSREEDSLVLRDTDRVLAHLVGGVLAGGGAGSEDLADAHVVAAAVESGGGVILIGDPKDLARLADPFRTVVVESLPSR